MGIDPGSVITGYGVVEYQRRKSRLVACGGLRPDPGLSFARRLLEIHDGLLRLVEEYSPDEAAVENVFYSANVKTLIKMCEARGAIKVALAKSDLPIYEYAPREVKQAVVGRGGASKEQVQFMIRSLFGREHVSGPYDITDALAVAVCHVNRIQAPGVHAQHQKALEGKPAAAFPTTGSANARARQTNRLKQKLSELSVDTGRTTGQKRKGR